VASFKTAGVGTQQGEPDAYVLSLVLPRKGVNAEWEDKWGPKYI
jgi:hypothetical protein